MLLAHAGHGRGHQPSTHRQLVYPGLRNRLATGRCNDGRIRSALRKTQQTKDWLASCLSASLVDAARLRSGIYGLIRHNESEIQQK